MSILSNALVRLHLFHLSVCAVDESCEVFC